MIKPKIPFIDLRGKTPIELLRAYPDKAKELVVAARKSYGVLSDIASGIVLPFIDTRSHNWLKNTANPYLHEIETFDSILETRGVFSLNLAYEWGCTSGAFHNSDTDTVGMMRILDWPFPKLGKHLVVTLQSGKAGDFYNVTWPGISGVFNAMAPSRFSSALNLAPMRRHGRGLIFDWLKNRKVMHKQTGLPPAHLLRQVFEQAADYSQAKDMLSKTPVAVPAIFVLAGLGYSEGCIIERLEDSFNIREIGVGQQVAASNQFADNWAKDMKPRPFLDSEGRFKQGCALQSHEIMQDNFSWLTPPMLNKFTRLCMIADAATKRLSVQGFEGIVPATELFNLPNAVSNPDIDLT